jgi:hypothetical protein
MVLLFRRPWPAATSVWVSTLLVRVVLGAVLFQYLPRIAAATGRALLAEDDDDPETAKKYHQAALSSHEPVELLTTSCRSTPCSASTPAAN